MADRVSHWKSEPEELIHQALGKACEEATELAGILARCMIQGLDATEPSTGKPNRQALAEEKADVHASLHWLGEVTGEGIDVARVERKLSGYHRWQEMIEGVEPVTAWAVLDMDGRAFHSVHIFKDEAEKAAFGLGSVVPLQYSAPETQMVGWQDISTASRDGSEVLVWNGRRRHVAHFDTIEGEWVSSFKTTTKRLIVAPPPTHWSPLPTEPATTVGQP